MKFPFLTRLLAGSMVLAMTASLSASPARADESSTTTITTTTTTSPVTVTRVRYPARITTINGDQVILDAYGTPVTLPSSFATYEYNGRILRASDLQPGQTVTVIYPDFNGNISAYNNNMLLVTDSNGVQYMIPRSAIGSNMYTNMVYVHLANGQYVLVPLRTALALQDRGGVIVSSLPAGVTLSSYAAADDVMSGYNRDINFSEGVRQQKDPSKLIQDQSIDGDSNF